MKELLRCGASVNIGDKCGVRPLHLATECATASSMQLLLQNGAELNVKDAFSSVPLHYAVWFKNLDAVRMLLSHGANPQKENIDGHTPDKLAVILGCSHISNVFQEHESKFKKSIIMECSISKQKKQDNEVEFQRLKSLEVKE